MFELRFEIEIMGSLGRCHRNITKLLGLSFDAASPSSPPILVVELADMRHPDLEAFFRTRRSEGSSCGVISPLTARCFISDVADGIAALHARAYVHADIKPGNVLVFADEASPSGWVAKVADFGFSGRVDWTLGEPVFHAADRPRGGTAEWDAPECHIWPPLRPNDTLSPIHTTRAVEEPPDRSPRDVYSFGLLCAFVALDGLRPSEYLPDVTQAKLDDSLVNLVICQLDERLSSTTAPEVAELLLALQTVTRQCLTLDPDTRLTDLGSVRALLAAPPIAPELLALPPRQQTIFETFPSTYDEFAHSGLRDAYLACPRPFRQRIVDSFERRKNHPMFPQFVPPRVWETLLHAQADTQ
ncbi:kinase-like protein [Auricularia subglabra TFB-10046 SS5]|nr:kinase-like protein [Auricularia subglabra TFB-10046 SS5]